MLPADYILEEWKVMVSKSKHHLDSDCPLIEDEVIVEMDSYIKNLEDRVVKLGNGFQNNNK